jgi:hypothetical protein
MLLVNAHEMRYYTQDHADVGNRTQVNKTAGCLYGTVHYIRMQRRGIEVLHGATGRPRSHEFAVERTVRTIVTQDPGGGWRQL